MNVWTKSNKGLPLFKFYGTRITLFREPYVDYVFTWLKETPKIVPKYFFCSHHPINLLRHNRKVIVPSFQSQPHKRKPYKRIYVPPPNLLKNQWYFQQQLSNFSLVTFMVSACSLTEMFGSNSSMNNNASVLCLDTTLFKIPTFQYRSTTHPQYGYRPSHDIYLWGLPNGQEIFTHNDFTSAVYLGNSMLNQEGDYVPKIQEPIKDMSKYPFGSWGNPFFFIYTTGKSRIFQTQATQDPLTVLKKPTDKLKDSMLRENPYIFNVRYNPYKDKGKGNEVYFIPNYDNSKTDWEPTNDPDLHFSDMPLWLIFWGIEATLKKMGKCQHLDDDWICVIKSKYMFPPEKYYVLLSYNFVHGTGPYDTDREDISGLDNVHWYPKYKFQREAINNIIVTGPAVCRASNIKNIQAKMKYDFLFKWGGNPATMENPTDPVQQPFTPIPGGFNLQNEINDPNTNIQTMLYAWDVRRDLITPAAAKRIKQSETDDKHLFTDGMQTSTDVPFFQTAPPEEETQETQTETLFLQLQQLQQYNQQLQQRFTRLKQYLEDQ